MMNLHKVVFVVIFCVFLRPMSASCDQSSVVLTNNSTTSINPALSALLSQSSGSSAPANGPGGAPATFQPWADTSTSPPTLRIYAGSQWVPVGTVGPSAFVPLGTNLSSWPVTGGSLSRAAADRAADEMSVFEGFTAVSHVTDVTSYAGAIDETTDVQDAINLAGALGKGLYFPAGRYNINSGHLTLTQGMAIRGEGWSELPTSSPNHGTIFSFNYPASTDQYGFYVTGSHAAIRDLEIDGNYSVPTTVSFSATATANSNTLTSVSSTAGLASGQYVGGPNISSGTTITGVGSSTVTMSNIAAASSGQAEFNASQPFSPTQGPVAIYAYAAPYADAGGHRLRVDNVMLRNVYDGIVTNAVRGGEFSHIMGQPLRVGISIDGNTDEPHLSDIHFGWTYWTGNAAVMAWQHANARSFMFGRVDNPQVTNIFSFNANIGIQFFNRNNSGNLDGLNGNTSLFLGSNVGLDSPVTGILADDKATLYLTGPATRGSLTA